MTDDKSLPTDTDIAADDVGATAMAERAAKAMRPRHEAHAGAAEDVGSVGYDEDGAFEIGSEDPDETERSAPGS